MRSKFQKRSAQKLADRIILHKHGYNTPQFAAELMSRAWPWVYTRDYNFLSAVNRYFCRINLRALTLISNPMAIISESMADPP